jgi:hypothetical protein
MGLVLPPIEAYQVQHLPIVKASADKMGVVEVIKQVMPTAMAVDPGTIVLGMILDTLRGRSPLYRLDAFMARSTTLHSSWGRLSQLRRSMMTRWAGSWIGSMTPGRCRGSRPVPSGPIRSLASTSATSTLIRPP